MTSTAIILPYPQFRTPNYQDITMLHSVKNLTRTVAQPLKAQMYSMHVWRALGITQSGTPDNLRVCSHLNKTTSKLCFNTMPDKWSKSILIVFFLNATKYMTISQTKAHRQLPYTNWRNGMTIFFLIALVQLSLKVMVNSLSHKAEEEETRMHWTFVLPCTDFSVQNLANGITNTRWMSLVNQDTATFMCVDNMPRPLSQYFHVWCQETSWC